MKTEILSTEEKAVIDWGKPQWVIYKDTMILTTGEHSELDFIGTCLPCKNYPNGSHDKWWNKAVFQPIPKEGLTIKITNE